MNMRVIGMMLTLVLCGQQMTIAMNTGAVKEKQESRQEQCKKWLKRHWEKIAVAAAVCGGVCVLYRLGRPEDRGPRVCFSSTGVAFEFDHSRAAKLNMGRDRDRLGANDLGMDIEFVPAYRCDNASRMQPDGCRITMTVAEPLPWNTRATEQWNRLRLACTMGGGELLFEGMPAEISRERGLPRTWRSRVRYDLNTHRMRVVAFMGDQEYLDATQHNS